MNSLTFRRIAFDRIRLRGNSEKNLASKEGDSLAVDENPTGTGNNVSPERRETPKRRISAGAVCKGSSQRREMSKRRIKI